MYPRDAGQADKPSVQALYQQLLESGYAEKDAAKEAQARTGFSVVTGQKINKRVEFSSTGKVGYSGQYPSRTTGKFKQSKPAAWPA